MAVAAAPLSDSQPGRLKQAALAYDAAGRFEEWTVLIESLIEKHRRKYKLRPLLEALRDGP
jgi:hypothetical protein